MKYLLPALLLAALVLGQSADVNEDVTRTFDFEKAPVIEVKTQIKFSPTSSNQHYYYVIPAEIEHKLISIDAKVLSTSEKLNIQRLDIAPSDIKTIVSIANVSDLIYYRIEFGQKEANGVFEVRELYKQRKEPFPATVSLREEQMVKFEDSKYYLSIYPTKTQKSTFKIDPRNAMQFYTKDETTSMKVSGIKYGPYTDIQPLAYEFLRIHYTHLAPMGIFTEVTRTIEISHWGNIKVEEHFALLNEGAGVKGEWGRIDYNSFNPEHGKSAITELQVDLPRHVRGLSYYDYIGNISTSNAQRDEESVHLEIEPRFPVFGQWNTDWDISYNMPLRYNLFYDAVNPETHIFNFTFLHNFQDILTENYTLKVILPEGSTDLKTYLPFEVDEEYRELTFTTLDYLGRPTVIIKKSNLLNPEHDAMFQISYNFEKTGLLTEAFYLILVIFVCFLVAMFYFRFELNLDDKTSKQKVL